MRDVARVRRVTVAWGVLSTARINRHLLAAAERSSQATFVAVASRVLPRAKAYAEENGIARAYGGYEGLLADEEVEAVYISLPNSLHVEWSVRALEAGKHVLCEKPLGRRAGQVEEAFSVADRLGLLFSEAFMYRHNPQTLRLKQLVDEGLIGRLRCVRATFSFPLEDAMDIRLLADLDGGSLMDVGCYCVSAARYLAGEPETVFGQQVVGPGGVDVMFAGTMGFSNDVISQFDCGFCLPMRDELEVIGEDATLFVDDPWHCRTPGIELRAASRDQIAVEPVDSYLLQLDDFSAAVRAGRPPLLRRDDAVGQARTIEALYRSADEERSVRLSP